MYVEYIRDIGNDIPMYHNNVAGYMQSVESLEFRSSICRVLHICVNLVMRIEDPYPHWKFSSSPFGGIIQMVA